MKFMREYREKGLRITNDDYENIISFYLKPGFELKVEFPSDWHEDGKGCLSFCFLFGQFYIHFPWFKLYEDHYQCSGPTFGFSVYTEEMSLFIYYGNSDGTPGKSRLKIIDGPWHWHGLRRKEFKHEILSEPETHDYTYILKDGTVQERKATIYHERRTWFRYWIPTMMVRDSINIDFDDEVGERTGSWKGGTLGCGWDLKSGQTPLEALREMEATRKF